MESVYSPENFMATEPLDMAGYFNEYLQVCPLANTDKENIWEARQQLFKEEFGVDFNIEELQEMEETCSVDKLRAKQEIKELPLLKKPPNNKLDFHYKIRKDVLHLETVKCKERFNALKKELFFDMVTKTSLRSEEKTANDAVKDIIPGSTFLYTVVVYKPFNTLSEKRLTIESILSMYEFEVLGTNTLTQLCDKIKCVSDKFRFVPVEDTKVDLLPLMNPMEKSPSRCFFIENAFYNDTRHSGATDYAGVVIEWAKDNKIGDFETKSMDVQIDSLKLRLGFGYVYIHQGKCEHIITFSDARLVQSNDYLIYSEYPRSILEKIKGNNICFICRNTQASWLVLDSDRLPVSRAFFCTRCCDSYMYLNGKKLGTFVLYPHYNDNDEVEKIDSLGSDEEILGHEDDF